MRNTKTLQAVLSAVLIVVVAGGCQNDKKQMNKAEKSTTTSPSSEAELARQINNLRTLGAAWHGYHNQHKKGPANWEELIVFSQNSSALTELRDSGCVVTGWGLRFVDAKIGMANFVLAYSPEAKQNKGPVLLMDAFVREMSAAELQQALEAQQAAGVGN